MTRGCSRLLQAVGGCSRRPPVNGIDAHTHPRPPRRRRAKGYGWTHSLRAFPVSIPNLVSPYSPTTPKAPKGQGVRLDNSLRAFPTDKDSRFNAPSVTRAEKKII